MRKVGKLHDGMVDLGEPRGTARFFYIEAEKNWPYTYYKLSRPLKVFGAGDPEEGDVIGIRAHTAKPGLVVCLHEEGHVHDFVRFTGEDESFPLLTRHQDVLSGFGFDLIHTNIRLTTLRLSV